MKAAGAPGLGSGQGRVVLRMEETTAPRILSALLVELQDMISIQPCFMLIIIKLKDINIGEVTHCVDKVVAECQTFRQQVLS